MEDSKKKEEKIKKPINMKCFVIKRIVFVIAFLCISIGITAYFIVDNISKNKGEEQIISNEDTQEIIKEEKLVRKHVPVINPDTDTFSYNSLKVNKLKENHLGFDIEYYQIDGLKNSNIENSINEKLKQDLENVISDNLQNGNILEDNFDVYSDVYANFSNVLSISYSLYSYHYNAEMKDYDHYWNKEVSENFNLNTGERLKLQDLFTEDTLGSDLFNSKFYSTIVSNYTSQEAVMDDRYGFTGDYIVTDYNDIEEEMLKIVLDYNNGKDFDFHFNEHYVQLLTPVIGTIYYEDCLDYVALYHNFKSDTNLFFDTYPAVKDLPVLVKRYPSDYQVLEESDNYYLDINFTNLNFIDEAEKEEYETINNVVIDYINGEVEKMKNEEIPNGKFRIYNYSYSIWPCKTDVSRYNAELGRMEYNWVDNGAFQVTCRGAKRETTTSLYNSELKKDIISVFRKAERFETGETRLYNNLFYDYLYDYDEYDKMNEEWEISTTTFYLDRVGNKFDTEAEALESIIWGTGD